MRHRPTPHTPAQRDRITNELRAHWLQVQKQIDLDLKQQTAFMDSLTGPMAPGRGHRAPSRMQRVMRFLRGAR